MTARRVAVLVNSRHPDTPYDRWVADTGIELTLFVAADKAGGYSHVGAPHHVLSFDHYRSNGNVERAVLELAAERPFDAVIARSEPDILRAARLRELLSLGGQGWDSALAFRHKVVMKSHVAAAGLATPRFAPLACGADLCRFVADHGYPVVVKPVLGSGSLGTSVVRGADDLAVVLAAGVDDSLEVETYVPGAMHIVDGLVLGGKVAFAVASSYVNDCLSFRRGEFLGIVLVPGSDPRHDRLTFFAERVLDAMPVPEATTFHMEIWQTADDDLVFCEVASRTGGLRINESLRLAHGLDMDRQWFCAQVGLPVDVPPPGTVNPSTSSAGNMAIYPDDGVLAALPEGPAPKGVVSEHLYASLGDAHHGGYKSGDCLAAFVVTGDTSAEVVCRFHSVASWFDAGVRWDPHPDGHG